MDWQVLFGPGERVIALPDWKQPRMIISARSAVDRWKDSGYYFARRHRAKLYKLLLRVRALSGVVAPQDCNRSDWPLADFLEGRYGELMQPVVYVGTPCAAHKWLICIRDRAGVAQAYVKWGCSPSARLRIKQEYDILTQLPRGLGPEPIKLGELGSGLAMAVRPIHGKAVHAREKGVHSRMAAFLETLLVHTPMPVCEHPGFKPLIDDAPDTILSWVDQLRDTEWPVAIQHGDLAPWNLLTVAGDELSAQEKMAAVDWEYARLQGIPYLDAAYYYLQIEALLRRSDPMTAVNSVVARLSKKPWPALSERHARAMVSLAAYDAWQHAIADGDSAAEPLQQWQRAIWDQQPARRRSVAVSTARMPTQGSSVVSVGSVPRGPM